MHNATVEIFDPGDSGFDYDRAARADRGPDLVRAALPPAGPGGAGPARQPGLGRRRGLRPRATTYAAPRCRVRAASTSCASWWPGSSRGRSTGTARCGRSTSSRASPTAGSRCSRSPTRCWSTASHTVDLGQVLLDSRPRSPRTLGGDEWRPAPAPSPTGLVADARAGRRSPTPARVVDTVRTPHRRGAARRRRRAAAHAAASSTGSPAGDPAAGVADQRRALPAAPGRHRAHRPRRLPHGPRGARRHRQRRHPGHRHRRAARLADGPLRVAGRPAPDPGRGAGLGDRRGARGHLARQPDRRPLRRPAGRRGQPGGPAAPGVLLVPGAQGDRPRRRRQPARRASPASRRRRSTRSAPGSRPTSTAAASSSASPTCPGRSPRCTPPARGWSRPTPCSRCCPATRWRSA